MNQDVKLKRQCVFFGDISSIRLKNLRGDKLKKTVPINARSSKACSNGMHKAMFKVPYEFLHCSTIYEIGICLRDIRNR